MLKVKTTDRDMIDKRTGKQIAKIQSNVFTLHVKTVTSDHNITLSWNSRKRRI